MSVVADDEVDLADVKSFLGDTGGHQRVVIAVTEGFDDAQLIGLSEAFAAAAFAACALTNEAHGFHQRLVNGEQFGDFVHRIAVLAEDDHPRRPLLRLSDLLRVSIKLIVEFPLQIK